MNMTRDPNVDIPATMEEAVAALGAEVIPLLQAGMQQQDSPQQRRACIRTLALIGTPAALELLGQQAQHGDEQLYEALRLLSADHAIA